MARALISEKKIIIMDEVTSYLDIESIELTKRVIQELSKDVTMLIITHQRDIIECCDAVYDLDEMM